MGLFSALLTLPLAPVRGVAWVTEQVADEVERQAYDPARVRAELLRLELDRDSGLIGEREYERRADELLERLEALANARGPGEEMGVDHG
jgi:gas vesicle protein GvpG